MQQLFIAQIIQGVAAAAASSSNIIIIIQGGTPSPSSR
jgi:hypothetical protein